MRRISRGLAAAAALVAWLAVGVPSAVGENVVTELVPGTAVLLNQSSSGGGGNGGNAKVASSATNIFAPAVFVYYKRFGGEPTVIVDRYPFLEGSVGAQRF